MNPLEDLRWYFAQTYKGDLGLHSNAGGMVDTLARGVIVQHTQRFDFTLDEEHPSMKAARRVREIKNRLATLPSATREVLRSAFDSRPREGDGSLAGIDPERALDQIEARQTDTPHALVGAILATPLADELHVASHTDKSRLAWLRALDARVRKGLGNRRQHDRKQLVELVAEGEALLEAALAAYQGAPSGRRVGIRFVRASQKHARTKAAKVRTIAWLKTREVASMLGVSRQRVDELRLAGRFHTTRRAGGGATAAIEFADHCVRAEREKALCACRESSDPEEERLAA